MKLFGNFGYIKLKDGNNKIRPINIRSIMVIERFDNPFAPNCKSRIIFLNDSFINIQESVTQIEDKIAKLT